MDSLDHASGHWSLRLWHGVFREELGIDTIQAPEVFLSWVARIEIADVELDSKYQLPTEVNLLKGAASGHSIPKTLGHQCLSFPSP